MTVRLARLAVLALLCANAPAAAQTTALAIADTSGEATVVRDGSMQPLRAADAVEAGTRIHTGRRGRVELRLEPVGRFAVGDASRVLVHSIEGLEPPARMHLVRLVVEAGAMQVDSRPQGGTVPADLRINLGALRMRVFGAAAWMERAQAFDEVCLIAGAIELQTPAGPQRLDEAGACLRVTSAGLQHLDAIAAGALEPRLLRTAVDARAAPTTVADAVPTEPALVATSAPESAPKPPPAPVEIAVPTPSAAPASATGQWTIVLASVPERERADAEAARLAALGLDTGVVAAQRGNGATTWRVVSGTYGSKADAVDDIAAIRARRGLSKAWLTQLP